VTSTRRPHEMNKLNGAPRRVKVTPGLCVCADYFGGNLTRFDPKTEPSRFFKDSRPDATPSEWESIIMTYLVHVILHGRNRRLEPKTENSLSILLLWGAGAQGFTEDSEEEFGTVWKACFRVGDMRLRSPSEMPH